VQRMRFFNDRDNVTWTLYAMFVVIVYGIFILWVLSLSPAEPSRSCECKPTYSYEVRVQSCNKPVEGMAIAPREIPLVNVLALRGPIEPAYNESDVELISRTVWGEARGLSPAEQRLVVWTIFQRVDYPYKWGDTIAAVITQPWQFVGYSPHHPICPGIVELVREELTKWLRGEYPPLLYPFALTVPYFFFDSDPHSSPVPHNFFREEYRP